MTVCVICFFLLLDMARKLNVEGYEELQKSLQDNQGQIIFVLFSGSLEENGQSWCPDCVKGIIFKFTIFVGCVYPYQTQL